ncbi:MAG: carbohydrate kinase family protein [Candidatus Kerfeldbacteria bacterium]|nr:carbohydrate kinase family protein [Candidatus Kerfeldbacteria bacterium]
MNSFDVVTIGSATRDVFLRSGAMRIVRDDHFSTGEAECFALGSKIEVDKIVFDTGGGATNTAVGFSRLGFRTRFIGRIGAGDSRGQAVLRDLRQAGVDVARVVLDRRRMTAYSAILLTPRGERTVLIYRGASEHLRPADIRWAGWNAQWLYVTSLGGHFGLHRAIWSAARRRGIRVVWNPGSSELRFGYRRLRPFFQRTDILHLNHEEATALFGLHPLQERVAFERLRLDAGGVVVITSGTEGSLAGDAHHGWRGGTHPIKVVDATGAGDAFGCGFTAMFIRSGGHIPRALQFANANAESVIQHIGAKAGLLRRLHLRHPASVSRL